MNRYSRNNGISLFGGVDTGAVLLYVALTLIGLISIFSAKWSPLNEDPFGLQNIYMKQFMWIGISYLLGLIILLVDASIWHKYAYWGYIAGILALIATLLFGKQVNGAKAWLGGVQPIEFAKVAIALTTARVMSRNTFSVEKFQSLFNIGILLLIPMGIVVLQNDTGSGIVLGSFLFMFYREGLNNWICLPILFFAGLFIFSFVLTPSFLLILLILVLAISVGMLNGNWKDCIKFLTGFLLTGFILFFITNICLQHDFQIYYCLLTVAVLSVPFLIWYAFRENMSNIYPLVGIFALSLMVQPCSNIILRPHQQNRIMSFLGLISDAKNDYNVIQSKIAIGSGGLFGKGFLQGSQVRYGFVPERHTDFIFCTVSEEFGFLGSALVLILMGALILRLMRMGDKIDEPFGRIYCYCVASILLFHTLVNVGMTIGIVPVMGIPLPFLSYGGSSLLAFTLMVFIAISLDASTKRNLTLR